MSNQIILKRSSTPGKAPTAAQLTLGEIAINTYDGKIFIKKNDGIESIVELGAGSGGSLTLQQVNSSTNTVMESYSNITTLQFDDDSGFDVTNPESGVARVLMNSTFKYWEVDGEQKLVASGLDTVNFIAGNGISITGNGSTSPQSIRFDVTSSAGGSSGGTNTVVSVDTDVVASPNHTYLVSANGQKTVTLPASPQIGTRVGVMDVLGTANTSSIVIDGNGANVTTWPFLIMNKSRASAELMYVASGQWNIVHSYQDFATPTVGEQTYIIPGTYSFVVPTGIATISAVLIGAGASHPTGGGGGGLRYINSLPVSEGETITVVVGQSYLVSLAEDSKLIRGTDTLVYAGGGGLGGSYNLVGGTGSDFGAGLYGGTIGGGNGGHVDSRIIRYNDGPPFAPQLTWNGGGGAGGYSGNGGHGAGSVTVSTSGSGGGAGGGGYGNGNPGSGGGGGVGIFGEGVSGSGGSNGWAGSGGAGGSGGTDGGSGSYNSGNNAGTAVGGLYGGGGGGASPAYNTNWTVPYMGAGGHGAVRIIWGPGRAFPSTNAGMM